MTISVCVVDAYLVQEHGVRRKFHVEIEGAADRIEADAARGCRLVVEDAESKEVAVLVWRECLPSGRVETYIGESRRDSLEARASDRAHDEFSRLRSADEGQSGIAERLVRQFSEDEQVGERRAAHRARSQKR
jgi:hypothetical protein